LRDIVRTTAKSLTEKDSAVTRLPARAAMPRQDAGFREQRFAV